MTSIICPGTVTSSTTCATNSNSVCNPANSGTCVCCIPDGITYVNTSTYTCTACASGAICGENGGYCNGATGSSTIPCNKNKNKNTTNQQWRYTCPANSCVVLCDSGTCEIKEWFMF